MAGNERLINLIRTAISDWFTGDDYDPSEAIADVLEANGYGFVDLLTHVGWRSFDGRLWWGEDYEPRPNDVPVYVRVER